MTSSHRPPRWAEKLLDWLLKDDWHTPAGDFEEAFHRIANRDGAREARSWYRRQVLIILPERLKEKLIWALIMMASNLKIATRTLRKHPGFAAINMGGLALGLGVAILMALFIRSELSYDRFHPDADRIVRVLDHITTADGAVQSFGYAPPAAAQAALDQIPEIEQTTRFFTRNVMGRQVVETPLARLTEGDYLFVDRSFLDMFGFELIEGNPATVLSEPNTVVITESAAQRYFGSDNPMGKIMQFEREEDQLVVGVIADPPRVSHIQFSMLFSLRAYDNIERLRPILHSWDGSWSNTYLKLTPGADLEEVRRKFQSVAAASRPAEANEVSRLALQPMLDVHFGSSNIGSEDNAGESPRQTVWFVALVALFILAIAIINFTNMSTAASMRRSREVGLRKAVGANRSQVARQFLGESTVMMGLSLALAVTLALVVMPGFNIISGKQLLPTDLLDPALIGAIALIAIVAGLLAGSYPAMYLSRFSPVNVLKGRTETGNRAPRMRRGLVVIQFALSIGLIMASLIVNNQMQYLQRMDLGYEEQHLVVVDINSGAARQSMDALVDGFTSLAGVANASVTSRVPGDWKGISEIDVRPAGTGVETYSRSHFLAIDDRFLDTFQMTLLEGRNISMETRADSMAVLINTQAARVLGVTVGDRVSISPDNIRTSDPEISFEPTVVGIVEDFQFRSAHVPIGPMVLGYLFNPIRGSDYFTIRAEGPVTADLLEDLEAVHLQFDPATPFEYHILEDQLALFYESERRMARIFRWATGLAILIACLGLFGLTAHSVTHRTKEIGIRKALGATETGLYTMLIREIVVLVVLAFLVAAPLTWWAIGSWLQGFAYHVQPGIVDVIIPGLISIACAIATVSWLAIRAARTNPVFSLRYE